MKGGDWGLSGIKESRGLSDKPEEGFCPGQLKERLLQITVRRGFVLVAEGCRGQPREVFDVGLP